MISNQNANENYLITKYYDFTIYYNDGYVMYIPTKNYLNYTVDSKMKISLIG